MIEIFFHYKVKRALPDYTVDKNAGADVFKSFTLQSLAGMMGTRSTSDFITHLIKQPHVQLLMQKINVSQKELPLKELSQDTLAETGFKVAQTMKGKYVTMTDIFVAYLLLIEKESKLLFAKQLKTEDLYNIIFWIRFSFPEEETPNKIRVHFSGSGIGEALVAGWTPETKNYTENFTENCLKEQPLLKGREDEFKKILEGLIKRENNNILLVGDIGAGKENLVRALAYHSFAGNLDPRLNYKRIFQLLVGALTAGAGNRSDLESRLQAIIAEVSHAVDVILYIPEFQNIIGGTSYNLDLSGAVLPYLKTGSLPIIATMTVGNYKTYMERNSLKEVFNVIELKAPDKNTAVEMVLGEALKIEAKYKVILSYRAIVAAVELSERFYQDQVLPGSAISLLEAASNTVALSKDANFEGTNRKIVLDEHVIKKVEETTHVPLSSPTEKETDLLLHLEDRLHQRIIDQNQAVTSIAEAMRRVRSGMATATRPISFLFLGPTGVGKTETAKALADFYFGGEKNIIRLDMSEFSGPDGMKRLLGAHPGQGAERGELTDKIHDNPSSLVLLDEFEKASPEIHNLFLQVLDDGRLTDNKGQTVSFKNAIIIATSNAGSEFIREEIGKGAAVDKVFQQKLLDYLQSKAIFKPELLNRFDDVVTFMPLGKEQVTQVVRLMLNDLIRRMREQDITLVIQDAVIEKIAQEGSDKDFGARPLRRYIQDHIEDPIAQKKLTKEIDRGKVTTFSLNGMGELQLLIS